MGYSEKLCSICNCSWHESDMDDVSLEKEKDFCFPVCPDCFNSSTELKNGKIRLTLSAKKEIIENNKNLISSCNYIIDLLNKEA